MSLKSFAGSTLRILGVTSITGAFCAAAGAAAGAAGAGLIHSAGHKDYDVDDTTKIAALGCAVLGSAVTITAGALFECGMFEQKCMNQDPTDAGNSSCLKWPVGYVGASIVGGLIGHGLTHATAMGMEKTALALLVGSALTMAPISLGVMCLGLPVIVASLYRVSDRMKQKPYLTTTLGDKAEPLMLSPERSAFSPV